MQAHAQPIGLVHNDSSAWLVEVVVPAVLALQVLPTLVPTRGTLTAGRADEDNCK